MPRPPASQAKAIIQKFAIVTYMHDLPTCTAAKHSSKCGRRGIWIGCKTAGRYVRTRDRDGKIIVHDYRYALCMHLRV